MLVNSAGLSDDIGLPFRILSVPLIGSLLSRPSRKGSAQAMKMLVQNPALVTDSVIDWDYEMSRGPGAHRAAMKVIRASVTPFGVRASVFEPVAAKLPEIAAPTLVIWVKKIASCLSRMPKSPAPKSPTVGWRFLKIAGMSPNGNFPTNLTALCWIFCRHPSRLILPPNEGINMLVELSLYAVIAFCRTPCLLDAELLWPKLRPVLNRPAAATPTPLTSGQRFVVKGLLVVALAMGALAWSLFYTAKQDKDRTSDWPSASGLITTFTSEERVNDTQMSLVGDVVPTVKEVVIIYTYQVGNEVYTNDKIHVDERLPNDQRLMDPEEADALAEKYPSGCIDPSRSIMTPMTPADPPSKKMKIVGDIWLASMPALPSILQVRSPAFW